MLRQPWLLSKLKIQHTLLSFPIYSDTQACAYVNICVFVVRLVCVCVCACMHACLVYMLCACVLNSSIHSLQVLSLDTTRAATTEGTGQGEVNVLLAVDPHEEGRHVHDLLADAGEMGRGEEGRGVGSKKCIILCLQMQGENTLLSLSFPTWHHPVCL